MRLPSLHSRGTHTSVGIKVAKFGGSSLADAAQFRKVQAIVQADPERRYVACSAPGKRTAVQDDSKITDLLYLCAEHVRLDVPVDDVFGRIADRYLTIVADLRVQLDLEPQLTHIKAKIEAGAGPDYAASRGEYLNGIILAALLGYQFVDAAEMIFFDATGQLDAERTQATVAARLANVDRAVIPGFYGVLPDGAIKTFSRGGSDITGAIVARGVAADVYENWTDVSGMLMADPRVVTNPRPIDVVSYRELRELAYMGASVLHDEAVFPARQAGIPIHIRNTNDSEATGTLIVAESQPVAHKGTITGIAGRKDFTVIALEKAMMNAERGFGRRVLEVLETNDISFEHMPTSIDTLSLVIADSQLEGKLPKVLEEIRLACRPDSIDVYPNMALIATVGRGMAYTPGMAAKLCGALARDGINIRMIDQGSSELNIIVGVEASNFDPSVRAIYRAFVE
ncbi:MAG: aspartate kinase [Chloroflexi bacterium]|nr:aspartate kinase [Chloroflexota bacterium]